eukprot:evm.model.NODE_1308_length_5705_cov_16.391060.1
MRKKMNPLEWKAQTTNRRPLIKTHFYKRWVRVKLENAEASAEAQDTPSQRKRGPAAELGRGNGRVGIGFDLSTWIGTR